MKAKKYILLMIFVILLGLCAYYLKFNINTSVEITDEDIHVLDSIIPGSMSSGRVDDMSLVDIYLIDSRYDDAMHLKIPKAYITSKKNWGSGIEKNYINIETRLPELKPAKALHKIVGDTNTPEFKDSIEKRKNGVFITLMSKQRSPDIDIEKNISKYILRGYSKKNSNIDGLEFYTKEFCKADINNEDKNICSKIDKDIFLWKKNEDSIYFVCGFNKNNGCLANRIFKNNRLKYMFRRSELPRWQEFDTAVIALLNKFYVKNINIKEINLELSE